MITTAATTYLRFCCPGPRGKYQHIQDERNAINHDEIQVTYSIAGVCAQALASVRSGTVGSNAKMVFVIVTTCVFLKAQQNFAFVRADQQQQLRDECNKNINE